MKLPALFATVWLLCTNTVGAQQDRLCATFVDTDGDPIVNLLLSNGEDQLVYSNDNGKACISCIDTIYSISSFYETFALSCENFYGEYEIKFKNLPQVTITSKSIRSGQYSMNHAYIENRPTILAETDMLRAFQSLPGIQGASEGQVAPLIRGGSADQTLVLIDGIPIFNPSHAIGYLGAINYEYIEDAQVFKYNYPVNYGGRLSGIIDAQSKDLQKPNKQTKISIGFPNTGIYNEGDIKGIKYLVAARFSYPSLLLQITESRIEQGDFFGKVGIPVKSGQLTYSLFANRDRFASIERAGSKGESDFTKRTTALKWGNTIQALTFQKPLKQAKFVSKLAYSSYYSGGTLKLKDSVSTRKVDNPGAERSSLLGLVEVNQIPLLGGYSSFSVQAELGRTRLIELNTLKTISYDNAINSSTAALAGDFVRTFGSNITIRTGLRLSALRESDGKTVVYPEPRVSMQIDVGKNKLDFAYDRMIQNIHGITVGNSQEFYQLFLSPSNLYKAPSSDQLSAGYSLNTGNELSFNFQTYVKRMTNTLFIPVGLNTQPNLQEVSKNVEIQDGRAYGFEASATWESKKYGLALFSYTYSKSLRRPINESADWFDYRWDRPHNLQLSHSFTIQPYWRFNSSFSYQSGFKYAIPYYKVEGTFLANTIREVYNSRYTERGPAHHRVDISASREWEGRKHEHRLTFSIYNVYGRKNPFAVFYDNEFVIDNEEAEPIPGQPSPGTYLPAVKSISPLRFTPGVQYHLSI